MNNNIAIVIESGPGTMPGHGVYTFVKQLSNIYGKTKLDLILKMPKTFFKQQHDTIWHKQPNYIKHLSELGNLIFAPNNEENIEHCIRYKDDFYHPFCIQSTITRYVKSKGMPKFILFNFFSDVSACNSVIDSLVDCPVYYYCHEGIINDYKFFNGRFKRLFYNKLKTVLQHDNVTMLVPNKVIHKNLIKLGLDNEYIIAPILYDNETSIVTSASKNIESVITIGCDIITKEISGELISWFINNKIKLTILTNNPSQYKTIQNEYVTSKYIENSMVHDEILKHDVMIHSSSIEMLPYALLESAPYIPIIVNAEYEWSKGLNFFVNRSTNMLYDLANMNYTVDLLDTSKYNKEVLTKWNSL